MDSVLYYITGTIEGKGSFFLFFSMDGKERIMIVKERFLMVFCLVAWGPGSYI